LPVALDAIAPNVPLSRAGFAPLRRMSATAGMRWALVLCLFCGLAYAFDFPPLTGRVVDQAGVIPATMRTAFEAKLKDLEDKSGIQLVVATVKSLQGSDIETFANQLFRSWKLGEAKKNNGVLLLVAPTERKVRIEVGYGLEGTLTDALSQVIIASAIVPRFKANDYAGGIERGVDGIISVLTTDAAEWHAKTRVRAEDHQSLFDVLFPILLVLVLFFVFRHMVGSAGGVSGTVARNRGRTVFIPYGGPSWGGGSSGGWGGSGGDSSGGGFSGGGGSSGGGGASGSW
jgi:uncharacterized protein